MARRLALSARGRISGAAMARGTSHQRTRARGSLRWLLLGQPPLVNVVAIDAKTEEVCGDEAGLLGLKADVADDDAVGGGNQPALPVSFADEDRGADG